MKFVVVGQNRTTGARMSMEFEAESKAAAERKATQAGMSVNRVEDITDGYVAKAHEPRSSKRKGGGIGGLIKLILVLAILAVAAYYLWPKIQHMLHH
jgi:hypothetical protein